MTRYLVVLEQGESNWAAYSPDVPGCAAVGETPQETIREYTEALRFHLEGLAKDGLPAPKPSAKAEYVIIDA